MVLTGFHSDCFLVVDGPKIGDIPGGDGADSGSTGQNVEGVSGAQGIRSQLYD